MMRRSMLRLLEKLAGVPPQREKELVLLNELDKFLDSHAAHDDAALSSSAPQSAPQSSFPQSSFPLSRAADSTVVMQTRIELRRKATSTSDTEVELHMTERLLPEERRLPAFLMVHFADTHFAEVVNGTAAPGIGDTAPTNSETEEPAELSDDAFASFEAKLGLPPTLVAVDDAQKQDSLAAASPLQPAQDAPARLPWLPPPGRVMKLEPLSLREAEVLLEFLMDLRAETEASKRLLLDAMRALESTESPSSERFLPFIRNTYLATALSPVHPFTADLTNDRSSCPALAFTLYVENISVADARDKIATLFRFSKMCIHAFSNPVKVGSATVFCYVRAGNVHAKHILLLNAMCFPGYAIRTCNVREAAGPFDGVTFHEQYRPVLQTTTLLRRVGGTHKQIVEAVNRMSEIGFINYAPNIHPARVRAGQAVLRGKRKEAIMELLSGPHQNQLLQQFVRVPSLGNAQSARKESHDSLTRLILKCFLRSNGDFDKTFDSLRRRPTEWIRSAACAAFNSMVSKRLRKYGRKVVPGDFVLKPENRQQRQGNGSPFTRDAVQVVLTDREARELSLEDVVLPFPDRCFPDDLFAPPGLTNKMNTRDGFWLHCQKHHILPLIEGEFVIHLPPKDPITGVRPPVEGRRPLSGHTNLDAGTVSRIKAHFASSVYFLPIVVVPQVECAVLEDKAPDYYVYDAYRQLRNDRIDLQILNREGRTSSPTTTVLEKDVLRDRNDLTGLARDLAVPSRLHFAAPGSTRRNPQGALSLEAPMAADVSDIYSVRSIVLRTTAPFIPLLREHFVLGSVASESMARLQNAVHKVFRQNDLETEFFRRSLTVDNIKKHCDVCMNTCHSDTRVCAEFQHRFALDMKLKDEAAVAAASLPTVTANQQLPSIAQGAPKHERPKLPASSTLVELLVAVDAQSPALELRNSDNALVAVNNRAVRSVKSAAGQSNSEAAAEAAAAILDGSKELLAKCCLAVTSLNSIPTPTLEAFQAKMRTVTLPGVVSLELAATSQTPSSPYRMKLTEKTEDVVLHVSRESANDPWGIVLSLDDLRIKNIPELANTQRAIFVPKIDEADAVEYHVFSINGVHVSDGQVAVGLVRRSSELSLTIVLRRTSTVAVSALSGQTTVFPEVPTATEMRLSDRMIELHFTRDARRTQRRQPPPLDPTLSPSAAKWFLVFLGKRPYLRGFVRNSRISVHATLRDRQPLRQSACRKILDENTVPRDEPPPAHVLQRVLRVGDTVVTTYDDIVKALDVDALRLTVSVDRHTLPSMVVSIPWRHSEKRSLGVRLSADMAIETIDPKGLLAKAIMAASLVRPVPSNSSLRELLPALAVSPSDSYDEDDAKAQEPSWRNSTASRLGFCHKGVKDGVDVLQDEGIKFRWQLHAVQQEVVVSHDRLASILKADAASLLITLRQVV